jgi:sugar/nucleoside kinase (ribokinase family)
MASLAWKYMKGNDIVTAIKYANKKALEVVTKRGVSVV